MIHVAFGLTRLCAETAARLPGMTYSSLGMLGYMPSWRPAGSSDRGGGRTTVLFAAIVFRRCVRRQPVVFEAGRSHLRAARRRRADRIRSIQRLRPDVWHIQEFSRYDFDNFFSRPRRDCRQRAP